MNDSSRLSDLQTPKGSVRIYSHCTAQRIGTSIFDAQFGTHAHYKSLYTRRESLEKIATLPDADVTVALTGSNHLIGFGVLAYPEAGERWSRLRPNLMMEVKAVEVTRNWRSAGVARAIIRTMMNQPLVEERIVYMVGYSWTWDLDGTGKTAQEYRQMLIRLFEPCGFKEYPTNESNICLKPENMMLARIGGRITKEQQEKFKWLRFNLLEG